MCKLNLAFDVFLRTSNSLLFFVHDTGDKIADKTLPKDRPDWAAVPSGQGIGLKW
jgi:hypothetical protein